MKKLMLIAAACVALASCVKNEVEPIVNDEPISFQAVKGLEGTRGTIFGGTDEDHFVATALLLQSGQTWATNKATAQNYFTNEKVTFNPGESKWTTSTAYYWPKQGSLTFFAFYPETVTPGVVSTDRATYTFAAYDNHSHHNTDFMVAEIVTKDSGDVPATFGHKLTKIHLQFKLEEKQANREITIKKVDLTNVKTKATYTMNTADGSDAWSDWDETKSYTLYDSTSPALKDNDVTEITLDKVIYIPQTLSADAIFDITYNVYTNINGVESNETVVVKPTLAAIHGGTAKWDINKEITYTIVIGKADRIYWEAPTVTSWTPETPNNFDVE